MPCLKKRVIVASVYGQLQHVFTSHLLYSKVKYKYYKLYLVLQLCIIPCNVIATLMSAPYNSHTLFLSPNTQMLYKCMYICRDWLPCQHWEHVIQDIYCCFSIQASQFNWTCDFSFWWWMSWENWIISPPYCCCSVHWASSSSFQSSGWTEQYSCRCTHLW